MEKDGIGQAEGDLGWGEENRRMAESILNSIVVHPDYKDIPDLLGFIAGVIGRERWECELNKFEREWGPTVFNPVIVCQAFREFFSSPKQELDI